MPRPRKENFARAAKRLDDLLDEMAGFYSPLKVSLVQPAFEVEGLLYIRQRSFHFKRQLDRILGINGFVDYMNTQYSPVESLAGDYATLQTLLEAVKTESTNAIPTAGAGWIANRRLADSGGETSRDTSTVSKSDLLNAINALMNWLDGVV